MKKKTYESEREKGNYTRESGGSSVKGETLQFYYDLQKDIYEPCTHSAMFIIFRGIKPEIPRKQKHRGHFFIIEIEELTFTQV